MGKLRGRGGTPVLRMPVDAAHRTFTLDHPSEVAEVRRWLREVLPANCAVLDDMRVVVSELVTNTATHGGGGKITLSAAHEEGRVLGRLVHHLAPTGDLLPKQAVSSQTARLLRDEELEPEELAEDSRGLLVVWHLCEHFSHQPQATQSVTEWAMPSCGCGEVLPC